MTANVAPSRYRNQTLIRLYVPLVLSDVHVCNPLDFTVQARKLWYAIKNDLCSPLKRNNPSTHYLFRLSFEGCVGAGANWARGRAQVGNISQG